jgi:HD-GYP domain-containing protein (c-di-GMP phosphodiesterase class II)
MSTPGTGKSPAPIAGSAMPAVVYFEDDHTARAAITGLQRYMRLSFERLDRVRREAETVLVTSSEQILARVYAEVRSPNLRVIAISDTRFRDPRVDGLIYAYLPTGTAPALVERMLDNAVDHIHLLTMRREINERLAGATREINDLNEIGAALSAEHDTSKLLEMILTKSREITRSDAGSLYIVEEVEQPASDAQMEQPPAHKVLRFKLTQNDSVAVPFREITMEINEKSIAGYVALTGAVVNIEDAYHLPDDVPYHINRKFDEDSGYRTKSILAVPMRNQKSEIVGVVQLINCKRNAAAKLTSRQAVTADVVPYSLRQQELVTSLASQAAVAFENSRLYEEIQRLFEGFVRASVIAIEARDPTTSGHSFRVANLTVALAETVDKDAGPFADVRFSRTQMKEIRYASLLHDFGKVGVREEVLVKAKKLYPSQLEVIQQRFQFVKRTLEAETLRSHLDYVLQKGREEYLQQLPAFDATLADRVRELDETFKVILQSNEPTVLPEGNFERLLDIAARGFTDLDGAAHPLLTQDEVRLLSIRKGSLDETERLQIESHVVHTYNFLKQIPWTREIRSIPAIARGHHEKLNRGGYPNKLGAPEIPVQTRMMTISDIFDALAASDRPYKRAVSPERALEILGFSVKDGELDPQLFRLFLEAKVFERWKIEPYPY